MKLGETLFAAGLVVVACGVSAYWIHLEGQNKIRAEWNLDKEKTKARYETLQQQYKTLQDDHDGESGRIAQALDRNNEKHKNTLAAVERDHAQRMRDSEARASIYQRQAQGGTAQCERLASYAARLDAALEEGRSLERQYRSALERSDGQLILLGRQIKADRLLLNTEPSDQNAAEADLPAGG